MASPGGPYGLTPLGYNLTDLSSANAQLHKQNIALQREVESLKEQIAALKLELEGRAVWEIDKPYDEQSRKADAPSSRPTPALPPSAAGATTTTTTTPTEAQPSPPASAPPLPADTVPAPPTASGTQPAQGAELPPPLEPPRAAARHGLSRPQVERYSRHLLLPAFGVAAQERLVRGSVLVVGCGGLGSPVAMYLAAAGVGRLGLVDHDTVDVTNLHRQVMHATGRVGQSKALSGRLTCGAINPGIQIDAHTTRFSPANALALTDMYDVVVDASDNPATRYLVSDACVVSGKPLVSAAAVGTDGQLTVYNHGEDGPCYRCLFPESPAPENCSRCGEAGVLGVVPGIMGCLQALEAIKILAGVGQVSAKRLTIFDALAGRFTTVRLRGRSPSCAACGPSPAITRATLPAYDYVLFTGQPPDDGPPEEVRLLDPRVRLEPRQVAAMLRQAAVAPGGEGRAGAGVDQAAGGEERSEEQAATAREMCGEGVGGLTREAGEAASPGAGAEGRRQEASATAAGGVQSDSCRAPVFLDVRPQTQYDIMALPGVVHVPFERLEQRLAEVLQLCGAGGETSSASRDNGVGGGAGGGPAAGNGADADGVPRVVVLCRRGNNSQRVAARLAALGVAGVTDMRGGYQAWAREVDPGMPLL